MRLPPCPHTSGRALRGWSRRGRGVLLSLRLQQQTPAPGWAGRCPGGAPRSDPYPGGTARSRLAPRYFRSGFLVPRGHGAERSAILALHSIYLPGLRR
ncbi:hypothetical protein NDU88_005578 [Pleurodeles waltl]|uniref:Uncharacterized protein n=1 Tax=Pleurodeles waltl TaxID=8319 RepID=A0AAV7VKD4_PLEWA|nr:hypothetical protein NDU88_005578 [Pleurodeles waltl]